tara:strand:- start:4945 stop:5313 length:369 start_codon:yes stop_codon:yes gene_type:complete
MIVYFENRVSKKKQDLILKVLQFAREEMFPRHKHISINITAINNEGVNGDCLDEDDREFTIRFDKSLSDDELITTLLHEMVHVDQHLRKFNFNYDLPYEERPHEIDAFERETILMEEFRYAA